MFPTLESFLTLYLAPWGGFWTLQSSQTPCWASGQHPRNSLRLFGFPSLGISPASPQATGSRRCQQTQGHQINGWEQGCASVTYFPGLTPLPYSGGLTVTTCEMIVLATATSLVLWITAIHWIVHKYPLPCFYAAYFLSSKLSQLLANMPQSPETTVIVLLTVKPRGWWVTLTEQTGAAPFSESHAIMTSAQRYTVEREGMGRNVGKKERKKGQRVGGKSGVAELREPRMWFLTHSIDREIGMAKWCQYQHFWKPYLENSTSTQR